MSGPWQGDVFLALGSNLGDRAGSLRAALGLLDEDAQIRVVCVSQFHEFDAVGGPPGQGAFLNAAVELRTRLSPRSLLALLLTIETRLGRERRERWGPRTIDLDLLLFGEQRIEEPELIVPHPRMWERPFVLRPLQEICPPDRLGRIRARVSDRKGVPGDAASAARSAE